MNGSNPNYPLGTNVGGGVNPNFPNQQPFGMGSSGPNSGYNPSGIRGSPYPPPGSGVMPQPGMNPGFGQGFRPMGVPPGGVLMTGPGGPGGSYPSNLPYPSGTNSSGVSMSMTTSGPYPPGAPPPYNSEGSMGYRRSPSPGGFRRSPSPSGIGALPLKQPIGTIGVSGMSMAQGAMAYRRSPSPVFTSGSGVVPMGMGYNQGPVAIGSGAMAYRRSPSPMGVSYGQGVCPPGAHGGVYPSAAPSVVYGSGYYPNYGTDHCDETHHEYRRRSCSESSGSSHGSYHHHHC